MNHKLVYLCFLLFLNISTAEMRTWTDSASGKTIKATFVAVSDDKEKVTLKRDDLKTFTMDVIRLSQEDQDFIKEYTAKHKDVDSGPGRIELRAKTTAVGRTRTVWSDTWAVEGGNGLTSAEGGAGSRVVGIFLNTPRDSAGGEYVVEIFWLGLSSLNKSKRYICAYANDLVKVPAHSEVTIAASSGYRNKLSSLRYGASTSDYVQHVSSWIGYSYTGWIVRVSDGAGKLLQIQGSQPALVKHVKDMPIPVRKK